MSHFSSFPKNLTYLVGVSGGADSMALAHLLRNQGYRKLIICHLHHGLRGEEADADLHFVENWAKKENLPFISARANVQAIMEEQGISLEAAARIARHDFFFQCAAQKRCPRIFLAHHADDQAETALWSILRGSHGVRGMAREQTITRGKRTLTLLRPLLAVRREELRQFLTENGHPWREDATNADPICARNRLRNEIIPLLNEMMQRDVTPALLRQCESTADFRACENWLLEKAHALDPQGRIHLPAMRTLPEPVQRIVMRHFLENHGIAEISRAMITDAAALIHADYPPTRNLPGGKRLRRRQGRIFLDP